MLPYLREEASHIIRERRGECKRRAVYWMGKGQTVRMKRLTLDIRIIRIVKEVTRKRMTDIFHMDTNLMGTPCFQS